MNRSLRLTGATLAAMTLAACGFTPLYAVSGVTPRMSAIEIHAPQGRTAFMLSEDLDDVFARDRALPPRYRLDLGVTERNFSRGLNIANSAKYFEGQLTVHYNLIDLASGKVLKTGMQPVEVSYAAADQPYAGISAQEDAQKRAANQAAQRIRLDIANYFAATPTP